MNKETVKLISVGAGSLIVGFGTGWLIANAQAKKVIQKGFEEITERYNESLDSIQRANKVGKYSTVEDAAELLLPEEDRDRTINTGEIPVEPDEVLDSDTIDVLESLRGNLDEYGHLTLPGVVEDDEEETEDSPEEGFEEEPYDDTPVPSAPEFETVRDPNGPYLISIDEYMEEGATPFTKVEMTYFEGDHVLVDAREQIVPKLNDVIGEKNLNRWGEGTTDKDMMYIRNERLEMDIEVTRDDNTYTRAVLNIIPQEEVRRSMIKPSRMRDGDDD